MKKQKGTSLIVVFIICTCISILLSTTFIVISNYSGSVLSRKKALIEEVKSTHEEVVEETPEIPES